MILQGKFKMHSCEAIQCNKHEWNRKIIYKCYEQNIECALVDLVKEECIFEIAVESFGMFLSIFSRFFARFESYDYRKGLNHI